jgi:hypothetical protein
MLYTIGAHVEQRPAHHKVHVHASSTTVPHVADRINSKRALHGYLQVGEVGKGEMQIVRRRWTQREKLSSRSPDVHRTVHLRKQQLSPSMLTCEATASAVIATGNLRQGRLMADHGGLYGATKLRQIEAKGGAGGMRARCVSHCKGGKRRGTAVGWHAH